LEQAKSSTSRKAKPPHIALEKFAEKENGKSILPFLTFSFNFLCKDQNRHFFEKAFLKIT